MEITATWDLTKVTAFTGEDLKKATVNALFRAGGDAIRATKTESSRYIRTKKRIKLSRIRKGTPLFYPQSKEIDAMIWRMDVSGKGMPVVDFPHAQSKKGVRVTINTGKRVLIKSAFKATMKSGHKGVFVRTTKNRLPIKELYSTRVSDPFQDAGMVAGVFAKAETVFSSTFERLFYAGL